MQAMMPKAETFEFGQGQSCLYSHRSPDKDSPNEDSLALFPINEHVAVLVVADGVGGRQGGEEASRIVIESFQKCLKEFERQQHRLGPVEQTTEAVALRTTILNAIETANESIIKLGTGAATTLAVAEIQHQTIRTYHVGDSMILLVGQRSRVKLQTVSHSPVGFAMQSGLLDQQEAMFHEERHLVFNVVGTPEMWIEMGSPIEMAPRDTLVLASDGLSDNLNVAEIVEAIRKGPLEEGTTRLSKLARRRMNHPKSGIPSKPDDLSVITYRRTKKSEAAKSE